MEWTPLRKVTVGAVLVVVLFLAMACGTAFTLVVSHIWADHQHYHQDDILLHRPLAPVGQPGS